MSEEFPDRVGGLLAGFEPGSRVAGYRLEEQVGAGGMAVVFRARDERLGRLVALKVLAPGLAADEAFRYRFIRESQAAAAVDDPHIIPVYEAGEAGRVLFIAMRFVAGGDLRSVLHREGALAPDRAAAFISPVASALDSAHGAGLVHRDVKPANMLVDTRPGRPDHIYLSDFGLSKGAVTSAGLTGSGQFLGTPSYSAPEQIEGRKVDGRTDQYALACVAFELLTGTPPFERDQGMAVLFAHLSAPVPSLTSRRPDLSPAADQAFAKALAKGPEDRYPSCRDFADALRDALGVAPYDSSRTASAPDHPRTEIAAPPGPPGPPGPHEPLGPGPVRTPTAAGSPRLPTAAVTTGDPAGRDALPASATVTSIPAPRLEARTDPGDPGAPGASAEPPRRPGRRRIAIITSAGVLLVVAAAVAAAAALTGTPSHPPRVSSLGNRSAASSPGNRPASSPSPQSDRPSSPPSYELAATLTDPHSTGLTSMAFSPDGQTLAGAGADRVYLWDIATGGMTATLTDPNTASVNPDDGLINHVVFSHDGKTLATVDGGGSAYLWDVATGSIIATLTDPGSNGVRSVAFSPNGQVLATGDFNGSAYLWDIATGSIVATLTDPDGHGVGPVAFSPDGTMLATADGAYGTAYVWDIATRSVTATLADPDEQAINSVAFSPDGKTLATGDGAGNAYLWDIATKSATATLTDPDSGFGIGAVAFSPNGQTLATGEGDGSAYLWDIATGRITATLADPDNLSNDFVAYSRNGQKLVTGGGGGVHAYVWAVG